MKSRTGKKGKKIRLGAHMSIAGGIEKSVQRAEDTLCNVMQIFVKNARQWKAGPLSGEERQAFHSAIDSSPLDYGDIVAHSTYLINLATPKEELYEKSISAFKEELERCDMLKIPGIVLHPGSFTGSTAKDGLQRVVDAFDRIYDERQFDTSVLIETTAGQGNSLGRSFEEIAFILDNVKYKDKFGVCLDTCHVFSAGYDISSEEGYNNTFSQFNKLIGIDKLRAIHLNDSKNPLASRKDRHEHIGRGYIGIDGFRFIMNDNRLQDIPKILETPKSLAKGKYVSDMDKENMKILRGLTDE